MDLDIYGVSIIYSNERLLFFSSICERKALNDKKNFIMRNINAWLMMPLLCDHSPLIMSDKRSYILQPLVSVWKLMINTDVWQRTVTSCLALEKRGRRWGPPPYVRSSVSLFTHICMCILYFWLWTVFGETSYCYLNIKLKAIEHRWWGNLGL